MTQKYLVSFSAFKVREVKYNNLSTSPEWWLKLKQGAHKDGLKVTYRTEEINGCKQVYYAIVDYPYGSTEEYFLMSSKKNAKIIKSLIGEKKWNTKKL